jgi:serine/threonine protein kinase
MMYHPDTDTLKLTDFGIARLTDSSKTKTGMVLGTPSYMSPEQLAGKKIEGRSDLFSLAVSLYQMLCGKLPFEGESMAQLMYKIANEPPTEILTVNPNVPPALGGGVCYPGDCRGMGQSVGERGTGRTGFSKNGRDDPQRQPWDKFCPSTVGRFGPGTHRGHGCCGDRLPGDLDYLAGGAGV